MRRMRTITAYITPDQDDRLRALTAKTHVPASERIRVAIDHELTRLELAQEDLERALAIIERRKIATGRRLGASPGPEDAETGPESA